MTPPPSSSGSTPEGQATKAYWVDEARRGTTHHLVYARTAKEAVEKVRTGVRDDVETMDWQDHPAGIQSVRRAPGEDRS